MNPAGAGAKAPAFFYVPLSWGFRSVESPAILRWLTFPSVYKTTSDHAK